MWPVFLCLSLSYAASAPASDLTYQFQVGLKLSDFQYKEFGADGGLLDREDGLLPGVQLGLELRSLPYTIALSLQRQDGNSDYRGQTQIGTPLDTNTRETIIDYSLALKRDILLDSHPVSLIIALGKRRWDREIERTAITNSLNETCHWPYYLLGGETNFWSNDKLSVGIRALIGRTFDSTLEVHIRDYDATTLDLRNGDALFISIPVEYRSRSQHTRVIELYLQYWHFEASPAKPLLRHGYPTGNLIHEPESETLILGITLALRF